jgi:hypothetical protein
MLLAQKAYAGRALALSLYTARLSDDVRSLEDDAERDNARLLLELLTPSVKSWASEWGVVVSWTRSRERPLIPQKRACKAPDRTHAFCSRLILRAKDHLCTSVGPS